MKELLLKFENLCVDTYKDKYYLIKKFMENIKDVNINLEKYNNKHSGKEGH
jgi:hypothetical protein